MFKRFILNTEIMQFRELIYALTEERIHKLT